jgi:DNA-binding MurR/RpiR family transcriptional regulator
VLNRLCKDIIGAKRVVILGRYRTSTAAEKLRMNLIDLGLTAITGTNTLDFQHLLYIIDENTAVIMFSTTGEVTDQKEFLSQLNDQTGKIWLITPAARAKMSDYATHTIELPKVPLNQVFAGSQTVMMAFADILTAVLSEYSGR